MNRDWSRRQILRHTVSASSMLASAAFVPGFAFAESPKSSKKQEPEVTAIEDLMREHGVIRRALLVYAETAPRLRTDLASVDVSALHKTAQLFRKFGEEYHEQMLEEQHIFPVVRKMSKELARYIDVLIDQHRRGREITDYILSVTMVGKIGTAYSEPLARAFEGMVRMYENHAAREDTIIFPSWKKNFTNKELDKLADQFEEIEHRTFGKDGFDEAEHTITGIEASLGLTDLAQFTAPSLPNP